MAHSPAPWRIGKKQERAILDANGSQIAVLPESLKTDAALIAAAPELLKACKESLGLLQMITRFDGFIYLDCESSQPFRPVDLWEKLESAIAKAEPQTSHNVPPQNRTE